MTKLKVYTLGIDGLVGPGVKEAAGIPAHRSQASVTIVAPSKAAALELLGALRGTRWWVRQPSASSGEFRMIDGVPIVESMRAAGLLDAPSVLVRRMSAFDGCPVVRVSPGGVEVVGHVADNGRGFTPVDGGE